MKIKYIRKIFKNVFWWEEDFCDILKANGICIYIRNGVFIRVKENGNCEIVFHSKGNCLPEIDNIECYE